jgi:hypothetical protein
MYRAEEALFMEPHVGWYLVPGANWNQTSTICLR